MAKIDLIRITILLSIFLISCTKVRTDDKEVVSKDIQISNPDLQHDVMPLHEDGDVNAVIEIPSGTIEKWELDKTTGEILLEQVDQKPRIVKYLGYPGNYGFIPRTLLSKENGGDGDPLDIIILGPPEEKGAILKCKIIGVLLLLDRGEQDDKLIAVSENSPLYLVDNLTELNENYIGVSDILQIWFSNYKGPGKMMSKGFGDADMALQILKTSMKDYEIENKD